MDTFWIKFVGCIIAFMLVASILGGNPSEHTKQQRVQLYNAGVTEMYEKGELSNSYE